MKTILYTILRILAKLAIKKYQPQIIAITGSVGKTSCKEAIFCVLKDKFKVARNVKNYNNEIGVPLTILRQSIAPGKNIFKWFFIFMTSLKLLLVKDEHYPSILILEMGADRPGDIKYLTSIAKPNIAVITAIGSSHIEYFKTIQNIVKEKSSILDRLDQQDWAIINQDEELLHDTIAKVKSNLKTFGRSGLSDVYLSNIHITQYDGHYGTSFKLKHKGSETPMFLPLVLGWQHAQAAASACAVGLVLGMNLVEIGEALNQYTPVKGRTNLIAGIKNSWIIDDTYNASPQSSKVALEILAEMPGRKIAIFGDMLELGSLSEEGHQAVGRIVFELGIDYLFVIGERARDIARGAKQAGMSEDKIFNFPSVHKAGTFVQDRIKENDIILVKGSRGAKMEQMVYEIMAKPWEVDELLVAPVIK